MDLRSLTCPVGVIENEYRQRKGNALACAGRCGFESHTGQILTLMDGDNP
jgi:hypothetical protein